MPTDRRISGSGRLALGLWLAVCTALLGLGAAESLGAASQAPVVYAPALLIDASIEKISGPRPGSGNGWTQCARIVLPDDARADLSSSGWEATLEISGGRIAKHGSAVLEVGSTAADFSLEEKDADGKNARTYSLRSLPSADHRSLPRIEFCVDYRTQWGASVSFFALRADLEDEISPEQRRRMRYVKDGRAYALQKETAIPKILTRRDRHVIQVRQAGSEMFFANWDTGTCRCLSNRNAVNPLNDLVAGRTSARTTTATPVAQPDMPSPPPPPPAVTTSQTRTSSRTTATTTKPKPSPTALIAGRVYLDANANGKYDDGEIGIPNVALFLTGTDTKGTALNVATKTDADGLYAFGDLWGTTTGFTVTEVQPAGFVDSGSPTTRITVPTLSIGTVLLDQNFGERAVAVTGNVLLESNQSPVPNVTIKIYPADSSGNKISGSAPVATAVTDYQGQYLLAPVSANQNYVIERDLPTAYKDPSSGALFLVIGTGSNLVSPDNNFNLALVNPAINPAPSGTIGGIVYVDWNSNGVYDTETPISGVVLRLTGIEDTGTAVSRLQITKPNGQFKWVGLRPGRYNIREYQPTGAYDSLGPTTSISNITVMDGMFSLNNNFGEIVLWTMTRTSSTSATRTQTVASQTIFGRIYYDVDDNGAFSNGDPGLRSVTVSARGTNTLGMAVATTAVTDCTGYYQFVIGRGSYNISKSNPAGFVDAPKSHLKSWTNVTLGSANLNQTWGVTTNASALGTSNIGCYISGRVFVDNLPTDGLFNITRENAISGVALKLTGKDIFGTSVSLTTTSASCSSTSCGGTSGCTTRMCADTSCTGQPVAKININGMYWFSGLKSGVYNVTETQPLGYQDPATGPKTVLTVDLRSTCYSTGNDFAELGQAGYWTSSTSLTTTSKTTLTTSTRTTSQTRTRTVAPFPGSVEGRVYSDDNSNGQYDGDVIDTPIGAVRIDIIGTDYLGNRVLMSSYSDPQTGMYSFAGVPAGTHRIVENHPDGYVNPPTGAQDEYAVTITSGLAIKNLDFIDVAE